MSKMKILAPGLALFVAMASLDAWAAPTPPPTRSVTVSPNPAAQNEDVTMTFTSSGDVDQAVVFEIAKVDTTQPGAGYDAVDPTQDGICGPEDGSDSVNYPTAGTPISLTFNPTLVCIRGGASRFRTLDAGYCYNVRARVHGANVTPAAALCITAPPVEDACENKPDLSIAATLATGEGQVLNRTSGTWAYGITVSACKDIVAGTKVQGGNVAWVAKACNVTVDGGTFKCTAVNKNYVITWTLPAMAKGDKYTLVSRESGTAKVAATPDVLPLNGPWSAVYQTVDEATSTDPTTDPVIPPHKTDYTQRVTIEVVDTLTP